MSPPAAAARDEPSPPNDAMAIVDVAIIGAGWSGLAAARALQDHGITNFEILEGRPNVGGRSVTSREFGEDTPIDLGSAWVHGIEGNPVQDLIRQHGLACAESPYRSAVWNEQGGRIKSKELRAARKLRDGYWKYMKDRQVRAERDGVDASLEQVLEDYLQVKKIPAESKRGRALRWTLHVEIEFEYAALLSDLSLKTWDIDDELEGGDTYLETGTGGGYSAVVEKFAAKVRDRICLDTKVTKIDYGDELITLSCVNSKSGKGLRCHVARHVLVTLPLGVLKAGSVTFQPELPTIKKRAISDLGNGLMNKCALHWADMDDADVFWPKDGHDFVYLLPSEKEPALFTDFHNPYTLNGGRRTLIAYAVADRAERMEKMSNEEVVSEALTSLRQMFGSSTVPEPTGAIVTRWGQDEFACGSYSYQAVGSHAHSRQDLARPIKKRLWFAGEATHLEYPSTTHGALLSGDMAGKHIAAQLNGDARGRAVLNRSRPK